MGIYYHKCNRDTLWGYNLKGKSTSGNHGSFPLLMYFTSGHTCTVCTLRTLCMFYLIKMKMWYHPQELLWPLSIGRFTSSYKHFTVIFGEMTSIKPTCQNIFSTILPVTIQDLEEFENGSCWYYKDPSGKVQATSAVWLSMGCFSIRPLDGMLQKLSLFFMVSPGWDNVSVPCAQCLVSETLQWNLTIRKLNRWYLEPPGTF